MEFFFEEEGDLIYCKPRLRERTVILRNKAVLPGSTLVATKTIYEAEFGYPDDSSNPNEFYVPDTPYYYSN